MNQPIDENKLQQLAASISYPATPNVVPAVWEQLEKKPASLAIRWQWTVAFLLLMLVTAVTVPPVRARLVTLFRIGNITIFVDDDPTLPASTPLPLPDLPGLTTLTDAQASANFPISYPPTLGEPDAVYYADDWQGLVTLVWQEEQVVQQILGFNISGSKLGIDFAEVTAVNNQPAFWLDTPHRLTLYDERIGPVNGLTRQVDGNVLIWTVDGRTYRLESGMGRNEMVALAESIENQP